jgi:D-alanyl-D-alanine dipeptidase
LQVYEKSMASSVWMKIGDSFPVVLGKKGLKWGEGQNQFIGNSAIKREGDNASPAGRFWLTSAFGDNHRQLDMPYRRSSASLKCVDDSQSAHYNRLVDETQVNKDWGSAEEMLRNDALYNIGIVVAHNPENKPAQGSCIFLHIWRSPTSGTAGCTAMAAENINRLAETLDMAKRPMLVQLPQDQYERLQSHWMLP